jgi:hypothetical protein
VVGELKQLVWPATCLEMRFNDPALPAIIACPTAGQTLQGEKAYAFLMSGKDWSAQTLALPESKWKVWIEGQENPSMDHFVAGDQDLNKDEELAMKYMVTLAIKVIAYASVPKHAPIQVKTREERKSVGIHPKHFESRGEKVLAVRYLPRIIRDEKPEEGESSNTQRRFMGRAGHIRFYSSDFYKNVKGQWQWIAPIPPPEGIKVIYRIRQI